MTAIHTYLLMPLKGMLYTVMSFIPGLVTALALLLLGYLLAKLFHELFEKLFAEVHLDKVVDKLGLSKFFYAGKIKHSVSHVLTALIYLIIVFMFLIMAVRVLGIETMPSVIGSLIAYIGSVISAVLVLIAGIILANVVGEIIYIVVSHIGLPNPKLHERVSRWAIILYAVKISLSELGYGFLFSGTVFLIWFSGLVLALALSYGLGKQDIATKYLSEK